MPEQQQPTTEQEFEQMIPTLRNSFQALWSQYYDRHILLTGQQQPFVTPPSSPIQASASSFDVSQHPAVLRAEEALLRVRQRKEEEERERLRELEQTRRDALATKWR